MFDESFVKAAPLQELSARERLGPEHRPAVRRRRPDRLPLTKGVRRLSALLVALLMAFGAAVYLGLQRPSSTPAVYPPPRLNSVLIPLVADRSKQPADAEVPSAQHPFAGTPAADKKWGGTGADAIRLPKAKGTDHFTPDEVLRALQLSREYLAAANVEPAALLGGGTAEVRRLIDQRQYKQFDTSMDDPSNNGQNTATGWLTRFDPNQVSLATKDVRISGRISYRELNEDYLEISTDHTFVYGLRQGAGKRGSASGGAVMPFTIRRELSLQFDHADVKSSTLRVVGSVAEAGPQTCSTDSSDFFRPVFPKTSASPSASPSKATGRDTPTTRAGGGGATPSAKPSASASGSPSPSAVPPTVPPVDPYRHGRSAADSLCGVMR